VVVISRNDGHGGDPLARLQAFVNTFDAQCRRFGLDAELIVVEWNPPADRPRLRELVQHPPHCAFDVRYIEVPSALHQSLPHPTVMPLFQMIGKNVGVRRARGRFVLCTNIDIIFSNDLVSFFAGHRLRSGVLYRVDRHDIESDYPIDAPLEEQQAYCREHHLRVHRSFGTFPVDAQGRLVSASPDVFEAAVAIDDGWHVREGDRAQGFYRWACETASVWVDAGAGGDEIALLLDLEPNPYDVESWVELDVADGAEVLARARLTDRQTLLVPLGGRQGRRQIVLRTLAASPVRAGSLPQFERRAGLNYRLRSARLVSGFTTDVGLRAYDLAAWRGAHRDVRVDRTADGLSVRTAPALQSYGLRCGPLSPARAMTCTFSVECTVHEGNVAVRVVDEAADRWVATEEYEVAAGVRRRLFVSVALTPGRLYSIYLANRHRGGDGVSAFTVHAFSGSVTWRELQLPADPRGAMLRGRLTALKAIRRLKHVFAAPHGAAAVTPAASLAAAGNETSPGAQHVPAKAAETPVTTGATPEGWLTARIESYAASHPLPPVHRNAAGDFQLMARENWFAVQGYAEFTMYSMNIDGLLGDVAHHAGIEEEVLTGSRCIYHLEHSVGSGWTPEGEGKLRQRLSESGADWLDASTVDLWSAYMDWLKRPMLFNGPDWGFGDAVLLETALPAVVD
jgi:hypothetical protein